MTTKQKWLRMIRWIRKEFPAQKPVSVRSVNQSLLDDADADSDIVRGRFVIRIRQNASYSIKVDALCHEWAHVLTWFGAGREKVHHEEWGIWYAKIYQAWEDWHPSEEKKRDKPCTRS